MKKFIVIALIFSCTQLWGMTVIRDTINVGSIYKGDSININLPIINKTTKKLIIRKLYWTRNPNFSEIVDYSKLIPAYSRGNLNFVVTNTSGSNRIFSKKLVVVTDEIVHRVVINGEFLSKESIMDKILEEAVKRKERLHLEDTFHQQKEVDILNKEVPIVNVEQKDTTRRIYSRTDSIIIVATEYLGTPYVYGGCTPGGFDCSGYVRHVFNQVDYKLPRTSRSQAKEGILIPYADAKPGDLIFFEGRKKNGVVGHVGIIVYVDAVSLAFIHSSVSRGVSLAETSNSYFNSRLLAIRRVLD